MPFQLLTDVHRASTTSLGMLFQCWATLVLRNCYNAQSDPLLAQHCTVLILMPVPRSRGQHLPQCYLDLEEYNSDNSNGKKKPSTLTPWGHMLY